MLELASHGAWSERTTTTPLYKLYKLAADSVDFITL